VLEADDYCNYNYCTKPHIIDSPYCDFHDSIFKKTFGDDEE